MYYIRKKYFFPDVGAVWLRAPHYAPIAYVTWGEVAEAYTRERFSNVRALGVPGLPASHIDIEHADYPPPRFTVANSAKMLDEMVPQWWQTINLSIRSNGDDCRCVMMQLFETCEHYDLEEAEELRRLERAWRHEASLRQLGENVVTEQVTISNECEDCGEPIPQTDRFCGPCATMQDWSDGI